VKWWLLAISQYIVIGVFTGSGMWFAWRYGEQHSWAGLGLIGILAVVAALVLGLNRGCCGWPAKPG